MDNFTKPLNAIRLANMYLGVVIFPPSICKALSVKEIMHQVSPSSLYFSVHLVNPCGI